MKPDHGGADDGSVATAVTKRVYAAHASLGEFSATSPWKVVGVSCGLCLAMMTGLSVMTVETNFDLLFMPRTSNTQKLKEFSVETFGPMPRPSVLLLRPAPDVDAPAGMLEKRLLSLAHQIHKEALGIKAPGGVGYDDVCIKLPSGKCITSTVFGYWKESESKMHADKNPLETVKDEKATDANHLPIIRDQVMIPKVESAGGPLLGAAALLLVYPTSAGDDPRSSMDAAPPEVLAWEKSFDEFSVRLRGRASEVGIEVLHAAWSDGPAAMKAEMEREGFLIPLSFLMMIVYLVCQLGKMDRIGGRKLVAFVAVSSVQMAYLSAVGVTSYFGWPFNQLTQAGVFVLLGIGIDDTFIIVDALERETRGGELVVDESSVGGTDAVANLQNREFVKKVGEALGEAGSSILLTTMTAVLSFLISATIDMPGIQTFCGVSALSLVMIYVLQCTFVVSVYVLDCRRMMARRIDCCCCLPPSNRPSSSALGATMVSSPEERPVARFLSGPYAAALAPPGVQRLAAALLGLLLISGAISTGYLKKGQSTKDVLPADTFVYDYYAVLNGMADNTPGYTATLSLDILVQDLPLTQEGLDKLKGLQKELMDDESVHDQAISWLDVFETWKAVGSRVGSLVGSSKESVAKQFGKFLDDPEFGAPFKRDVRCSGPSTSKCGGLKSSRLHLMTDLATGANIVTFIPGMARVKAICAKWRAKGLKVQPFSDGFLYLERLQLIDKSWMPNLAMAFVAVLLTMLLFQPPMVAFVAAGCIASTVMCMVTVMLVWDVKVNMLSNMMMVLAVGYSVDFTAHIAQAFFAHSQQTNASAADHVAHALGSVGASVLNGGFSTLLALMVLGLSNVAVMQIMFKLFLATVGFGLLHGFFFLPALLQLSYSAR